MSTPFQKRRRLNEETLYKPFKSPVKQNLNASNPPIASDQTNQPSAASEPASHPTNPRRSHLSRTSNIPPAPPATAATHAVESQIKQLRGTIEALTHATRLVSSGRDAELAALTKKWRATSRTAAEELFAGVRDKIDRMGGVGAWREMEREKAEKRRGWGEPEGPPEDGEEDGLGSSNEDGDEDEAEGKAEGSEARERREEREERCRLRKDARRERREVWDAEKREYDRRMEEERRERESESERVDVEMDDDAFTMDMMLRTLNVELDVIGYDKREQRWVD